MNYYISDVHFFHKNCIEFDSRPFSTIEQMHKTMVDRWNRKITEEDTVYILGMSAWVEQKKSRDSLWEGLEETRF